MNEASILFPENVSVSTKMLCSETTVKTFIVTNLILTFCSSKNPDENVSGFPQKYFVIWKRNVSWAANQHFRMISEKSCDEDWNNDAENSALHHRKKLQFKIYLNRKCLNCYII